MSRSPDPETQVGTMKAENQIQELVNAAMAMGAKLGGPAPLTADALEAARVRLSAARGVILRALQARQAEPVGWRSIHEWFSDGGYDSVIVCVPHDSGVLLPSVGEARHRDEEGWYWAGEDPTDYHARQIYPTHWQPLPAPPRAPDRQQEDSR